MPQVFFFFSFFASEDDKQLLGQYCLSWKQKLTIAIVLKLLGDKCWGVMGEFERVYDLFLGCFQSIDG